MIIKYRKNDEWRIHTFLIGYEKLDDLDSIIFGKLNKLYLGSSTFSVIDIIDIQLLAIPNSGGLNSVNGKYRVTVYFALSNDIH